MVSYRLSGYIGMQFNLQGHDTVAFGVVRMVWRGHGMADATGWPEVTSFELFLSLE